MSSKYEQQYNPISNQETEDGNPLSVRFFRDLADGINNFKQAFPIKLMSFFDGYDGYSDLVYSPIIKNELSTDHQVIGIYAPRYVPSGYNKYLIQVGHKVTAGVSSVNWYVYILSGLYSASVIDSAYLNKYSWACSSAIISDSTDYTITEITLETSIRDSKNQVWLLVTADPQNDSTQSIIQTLDITCLVE